MNNHEVATFIVKAFIRNGEMHSCDNCESWNRQSNKCDKFGITPPVEVILYSCGKDWVADIPF